VPGGFGKWPVAGDDRRLKRFGEGDVHGVVGADVVAQLPRTTQEIAMRVTVKIEVGKVRNRLVGTDGRNLTCSHEASKDLNDLDVQQVRSMKVVPVAKEAGLDSRAKWSLEEKLQQGRRVDDDHA